MMNPEKSVTGVKRFIIPLPDCVLLYNRSSSIKRNRSGTGKIQDLSFFSFFSIIIIYIRFIDTEGKTMEWKKTGITILSMSMALLLGGCSSEGHVTAYTAEPYYLYAEAMKSAPPLAILRSFYYNAGQKRFLSTGTERPARSTIVWAAAVRPSCHVLPEPAGHFSLLCKEKYRSSLLSDRREAAQCGRRHSSWTRRRWAAR